MNVFARSIVKSALRDMPKWVPKYGQLELFPQHSAKEAADRFAAYMRDSHVVGSPRDNVVKPLRLYHATPRQYDAFKVKQTPAFGDTRMKRHAIFASEDPEYAEEYAKETFGDQYKPGANVLPIYASIRNPLDITDEGLGSIGGHEADRLMTRGISLDEIAQNEEPYRWHYFDDDLGRKFVGALRNLGYDGVKLKESFGSVVAPRDPRADRSVDVWAAFDPTQFKSVFNRGSFSAREPHLLKARGGRISSFKVKR